MLIASAKSRIARGAFHQPAFTSGWLTVSHTCLPCLPSGRMLLLWRGLFVVGREVSWEGGRVVSWEGGKGGGVVARWEMWENSELAQSERWEGSEVAISERCGVVRWQGGKDGIVVAWQGGRFRFIQGWETQGETKVSSNNKMREHVFKIFLRGRRDGKILHPSI